MPPAYPAVPEWIDLAHLSERANALMWQNWDLINQAAELLNAGDYSPLAWEQLQDIWAEAIELEAGFRGEMQAAQLYPSMDQLLVLLPQFKDLVARSRARSERGL